MMCDCVLIVLSTGAISCGAPTLVATTKSCNMIFSFLLQSLFLHLPQLHQWIGGTFVVIAVLLTALQDDIRQRLKSWLNSGEDCQTLVPKDETQ